MTHTMKNILLGLLVLVLQLTLANWIRIVDVKPDLVLLFVIYIGYKEGKSAGILYGFLFGLLQDVSAASSFIGLSPLVKSILGFGAGFMHGKFHVVSPVLLYGIVVLLILFANLLYFGIFYAAADYTLGMLLRHYVLPSFGYTLIVGSLLITVLPLQPTY